MVGRFDQVYQLKGQRTERLLFDKTRVGRLDESLIKGVTKR